MDDDDKIQRVVDVAIECSDVQTELCFTITLTSNFLPSTDTEYIVQTLTRKNDDNSMLKRKTKTRIEMFTTTALDTVL